MNNYLPTIFFKL